MIKIFVTGDNHIGLKYASHTKSNEIIEARISAIKNMVDAANEEKCDIFAVTGDLFENTYSIAKKDVKRIFDIFSEFKNYVVFLPGNHDYYDEEATLWKHIESLESSYDNILIFKDYRKYELKINEQDVVFYPALCKSKHSMPGENNLGWIKKINIEKDKKINIGIAHGAVEGETIDKEGAYFMMSRNELNSIPVDVWLIGHTHVPFPRNLEIDKYITGETIFNPGTHVQANENNNTDGECFIIEIDDNKTVRAKKYISGNIHFYRKDINVTPDKLESIIENAVGNFEDNSIVELNLSGVVNDEEYENRHTIISKKLDRFLESEYKDSDISLLISKEKIDAEFAETSVSGKLLSDLLEVPKEAQLAYELLNELKGDK